MKQYLDLVREVLSVGTRKPNRTGVDTLSTFNHNYEIDLRQGFPLLTTKEISWKNIVVENLWFLSGETHIGLLKKHGCKFWDPWADASGRVPSAYGNFWRHFPVHEGSDGESPRAAFNDQIRWVSEEIKRNPASRRLVVTAWAPGNAQTSKLPPCHLLFMFNVQQDEHGEPLQYQHGDRKRRQLLRNARGPQVTRCGHASPRHLRSRDALLFGRRSGPSIPAQRDLGQ